MKKANKISILTALLGCGLGLSGCGVDDIQFNGKIFDAVGLNTGSVKRADPKLRERQPLLVPPTLGQALPAPGTGGKADQPALADVQDHDAKRTTSQAELERQQAEYCQKNYIDAQVHGDQTRHLATGPLGPCQASVMTAIKNINKPAAGDEE